MAKCPLCATEQIRNNPWIKVADMKPEQDQLVLCRYIGVYDYRLAHYWNDGINDHFGYPNEPDGKGSQPATHWYHLPY